MGDIETSMMKRLLGESEYGRLTAKPAVNAQAATTDETIGTNFGTKTLSDLRASHGDLTLGDIGLDPAKVNVHAGNTINANTKLNDAYGMMPDTAPPFSVSASILTKADLDSSPASILTNQSHVLKKGTPAVAAQPAQSVRTQALNAIRSLTPDQVKSKGVGSSYMQKLLTDNKRGNMGANMRVMTLSGAALAGVPFTGRRNDHSSGFNKNRGNKI